MTELGPRLTKLDQHVIDALPAAGCRGRRAAAIATDVAAASAGAGANAGPRLEGEVLGILRGLEHLGRAHNDHGWWTA